MNIKASARQVLMMVMLVPALGLFSFVATAETIDPADIVFDQDQELDNGGCSIWDQHPIAQTFTPGVDGQLAYVGIDIYPWKLGTVPATVSIVNTVDGVPSGTVLGEMHLPSPMNWWNTIDFLEQNIWLKAGALYGIVFSNDDPVLDDYLDCWAVRWEKNPYEQGELWRSTPETGWNRYNRWGEIGDADAAFRTWMVVPEPSVIALLGMGAVGLVAWSWRRKRKCLLSSLGMIAAVFLSATPTIADTFGSGANQFTIDFAQISGATNPVGGSGVVHDNFRIGKYEITNAQWDKFKASYGTVTGEPSIAYGSSSSYKGANVPRNSVSWYEAAQFVNWLNTNTGHQAAYKFTGTRGTSNYTLGVWSAAEADNGTNLYRHKDAYYFLPTEDEWIKAAHWNGSSFQMFATKEAESLRQGSGANGGWNYRVDSDFGPAGDATGPWSVGSGSEELNGTFDMMGNLYEWVESPFLMNPPDPPNYDANAKRCFCGGSFLYGPEQFAYVQHAGTIPENQNFDFGFRVASVPEPSTIALLLAAALGGLLWRRRA